MALVTLIMLLPFWPACYDPYGRCSANFALDGETGEAAQDFAGKGAIAVGELAKSRTNASRAGIKNCCAWARGQQPWRGYYYLVIKRVLSIRRNSDAASMSDAAVN